MSLFDGPQPVGYMLILVIFGCLALLTVFIIESRRTRWDEPMNDRWRDAHREDR